MDDGDLLARGLRERAGRPDFASAVLARIERRPRRWMPLAAAAALLAGIAALFVSTPPPPAPAWAEDRPSLFVIQLSEEAGGDLMIIPVDRALWAQVVSVDGPERVGISAGSDDGVHPGQRLSVYRGRTRSTVEVGTFVAEEVETSLSRGRIEDLKFVPHAGDFVVPGRPLDVGETAALLDYVFSFGPVTDELRARARKGLLDPPTGALRVALDAERVRVDSRLFPHDRLVRGAGLEHDVEFLARIRDPRAYERLQGILSAVMPGLPEAGPGLTAELHAWWAGAKGRLRWNAEADRFEE